MKKILLLLLVISSSYASASFPENLFGLKLGMDRQAAEIIMKKYNLKECEHNTYSPDVFCYSGDNIQILGILFDEVSIIYDERNMIKGVIFRLFIPQSEGTQRRIFRHLYDEIKPFAKSVKDENIRFNYLFKMNDRQYNNYVRLSIKEVLQGEVGYYIVLTSSYTDKRLNW